MLFYFSVLFTTILIQCVACVPIYTLSPPSVSWSLSNQNFISIRPPKGHPGAPQLLNPSGQSQSAHARSAAFDLVHGSLLFETPSSLSSWGNTLSWFFSYCSGWSFPISSTRSFSSPDLKWWIHQRLSLFFGSLMQSHRPACGWWLPDAGDSPRLHLQFALLLWTWQVSISYIPILELHLDV